MTSSMQGWVAAGDKACLPSTFAATQSDCITKALAIVDWTRPEVAHLGPRRARWRWMRESWGVSLARASICWEPDR